MMKTSLLLPVAALAALAFSSAGTSAGAALPQDPPPVDDSYLVMEMGPEGELGIVGWGNAIYMSYMGPNGAPPIVALILDLDTWEPVDMIVLEPGGEVTVPITQDSVIDASVLDPANIIIDAICANDCFPADALVATPSGRRPIESLEVGDPVLSDHGAATIERIRVSKTLALTEIDLDQETVRATAGHAFRTDHGWVRAGDLEVGDRVITQAGQQAVRAIRTEELTRPAPVFSLELSGGASFQVGEAGAVVAASVAE